MTVTPGYEALSLDVSRLVQDAAALARAAQPAAGTGRSRPVKALLCSQNVRCAVAVSTFSMLCARDMEQGAPEAAVTALFWGSHRNS